MKIKTGRTMTKGDAREAGLWMALIMLLGQHFSQGPLQPGQVGSSLGGGIGIWLTFRFIAANSSQSDGRA